MRTRNYLLLVLFLGLVILACGGDGAEMPRNAVVVEVRANSGIATWLHEITAEFNQAKIETADGKPIYVQLEIMEAGQAVAEMSAGGELPALWIPDDEVWTSILADRGQTGFQGNCVSVARSPLVIAMWRPIAEGLGWPGRSLGWLDISSLAADPSAWAYYSGGQYGDRLRLGHTHPGLSGSGVSTLLAVVQAAESKTEAVTVEEIEQPIVQASMGTFEGTVAWFSSSTDQLGQTMRERGPAHLGAAVMYENIALLYGGEEIVPIYPFEGTFIATHPACIYDGVSAEARQGASTFRDYLLDPGQKMALRHGLRPALDIDITDSPLARANGVDLAQPAQVFSPPNVQTVYAVQELWQATRKPVNLVMLLDTSGSMRGAKIANMRRAATQFMAQMGDEDYITLISFASQPVIRIQHRPVGEVRAEAIRLIDRLAAQGDTSLYDAIGMGAAVINDSTSTETGNAMVVLTDGQDTSSYTYRFDDRLIQTAIAHDTTVFTIAYGGDADERLLSDLAIQANGNFYRGTEASIAAIYEEMSAAFGGAVGIGR